MKKICLLIGLVSVLFVSCEKINIDDEVNSVEIQGTDQDDSVNTGGGGNPQPSNDEE